MFVFGNRLRKLRHDNLISQHQLIEKLNELGCNITSKSAISQYETNKRLPDMETIICIANFFNVSIDYLLGEQNEAELTFMLLFRKLDDIGKLMVYSYATALNDTKGKKY